VRAREREREREIERERDRERERERERKKEGRRQPMRENKKSIPTCSQTKPNQTNKQKKEVLFKKAL